MFSTSCTDITYCVPSKPCANTECQRHRDHAPVEMVGVSVSDFWAMCSEKQEYRLPFPIYEMHIAR